MSSERAVRWERDALPLRFRILDTGNLPEYGNLTREKWREIVRAGFGAWTAVETADIGIVLEDLHIASIRSDGSDRINTIGFEVAEDRGYPASALWIYRDGRMLECDIHFDPTIFDNWPRDDPAVQEWAAYFLEEVVAHEMGHCLGLTHAPANPVWLGQSANSANWPPGFLPETLAGLSPDPQMSIAASYGVPRLMPNDRIGVSLLIRRPGSSRSAAPSAGASRLLMVRRQLSCMSRRWTMPPGRRSSVRAPSPTNGASSESRDYPPGRFISGCARPDSSRSNPPFRMPERRTSWTNTGGFPSGPGS